jgi:CBS domain containing-hemolysin-like protein
MLVLLLAIFFTLTISALCSLLEAMLLSTSTSEIEQLKIQHPKKGFLLEKLLKNLEETSSAILGLNTIANTLGASVAGGLALKFFGESDLIYFSLSMTFAILLFSEILPKNIGVLYRSQLLGSFVYPMYVVCFLMRPISLIGKKTIRLFIHPVKPSTENDDNEIIFLAEKRAQEGSLTNNERDMISNALNLDDIPVSKLKIPRQVVSALDINLTLSEVFKLYPTIPFSRFPVYENHIDNIIGVVRLKDMVNTKQDTSIRTLMHPITFIPETASAADALQTFLKKHQQFAATVDEFGSTSGLLTLEDIFEYILGQQIFEDDDLAVSMRDLAKLKKNLAEQHSKQP